MRCLFARDIVLYIYRREGGALNKQEYMKEYRKKLSPIRADLTIEERKELNKILERDNLSVVKWIRQKIEQDK